MRVLCSPCEPLSLESHRTKKHPNYHCLWGMVVYLALGRSWSCGNVWSSRWSVNRATHICFLKAGWFEAMREWNVNCKSAGRPDKKKNDPLSKGHIHAAVYRHSIIPMQIWQRVSGTTIKTVDDDTEKKCRVNYSGPTPPSQSKPLEELGSVKYGSLLPNQRQNSTWWDEGNQDQLSCEWDDVHP